MSDKIQPYDIPSVNYVHKQIIHRENITKERKYEGKNRKLDFTISPYTCKIIIFNVIIT